MGRRRLSPFVYNHVDIDGLHQAVDAILEDLSITEGRAGEKVINPRGLNPTRRDPYSRLERRVRDKATPQKRDLFRAKRERDQRNRRRRAGPNPPRKVMGKSLRPKLPRRPGL